MARFPLTPPEAAALAASLLGRSGLRAEPIEEGWGNDNWRVAGPAGERWLLKVSPASYAPKWAASHRAMDLAARAGVPAPRLVAVAVRPPAVARVLTWIEGEPAASVVGDRARTERFVASLGGTLRRLHQVRPANFSSRADGSAARFGSWAAYLEHRLAQVAERCRAGGAVGEEELTRTSRAVAALARAVDGEAVPTLCHRDLHLGNLLVDARGEVTGVLDWDGAEVWDAAGDTFKLEWLLAPALGVAPADLEAAELGPEPPPRWAERKLAVQLIEALNVIPNAVANGWDPAFTRSAREQLAGLLSLL